VVCLSTASAFTVTPPRVELQLDAGEERDGAFTVSNPTDEAVKIKVAIEDWSIVAPDDGREILKGEQPALSWIDFSPEEFFLEPHTSEVVTYTIRLPYDAHGSYIGMIYFGEVPTETDKVLNIVTRIGNSIYVTVKGTEIVDGEIAEINVIRTNTFKARVLINNLGNIYVRPKGKITIRKKGMFLKRSEKKPIEVPFNHAGFPAFPFWHYTYEPWSKDTLGPGRYSLELETSFGEKTLRKTVEFSVTKEGAVRMVE
jgi:hypothetical protein